MTIIKVLVNFYTTTSNKPIFHHYHNIKNSISIFSVEYWSDKCQRWHVNDIFEHETGWYLWAVKLQPSSTTCHEDGWKLFRLQVVGVSLGKSSRLHLTSNLIRDESRGKVRVKGTERKTRSTTTRMFNLYSKTLLMRACSGLVDIGQ